MPAAIPAIAAAWASVSAAVATVGTALAFKAGIVAGLAAWGKVALVTTVLSTALMLKPPGLDSQGQQVNIQMAGPSAALPWIFGRTGTQGIITYRATYGGGNAVPIDRGGRLSCFVRSPKVATFNLAADEVLGSRRVTTSTPMSQRFNRIIPSCRQENQKWEMIAGQPVADLEQVRPKPSRRAVSWRLVGGR